MQLLDRMHNCVMANRRFGFGSASGRTGSTSVGREKKKNFEIMRPSSWKIGQCTFNEWNALILNGTHIWMGMWSSAHFFFVFFFCWFFVRCMNGMNCCFARGIRLGNQSHPESRYGLRVWLTARWVSRTAAENRFYSQHNIELANTQAQRHFGAFVCFVMRYGDRLFETE